MFLEKKGQRKTESYFEIPALQNIVIAEIQWKIEWSEKFKLNTYSFKLF